MDADSTNYRHGGGANRRDYRELMGVHLITNCEWVRNWLCLTRNKCKFQKCKIFKPSNHTTDSSNSRQPFLPLYLEERYSSHDLSLLVGETTNFDQ